VPDLRIENLGQVGLSTDVPPNLLPLNALTEASNVVAEDGAISSSPGERLIWEGTTWATRPLLDVRPLYHRSWVDDSQAQWVIISDGVNVWAYDILGDGTGEKITPTDDDTPAGASVPWSSGRVTFATLNGILVVNSASDGLFYWGGTATVLIAAPGWTSTWRCAEIAAYRYALVALGMTEGANEYPHKIRWSNSAAEGALPTTWTIAATNDAGDDILGETEGVIVGGCHVRDQLYIVKEDAVYSMRWIGGPYIHQVSRLKGGIGTRNPKGFCEMRGHLVVLTTSDVYLFDGQNSRSLLDGHARNAMFDAIAEENWDNAQVFFDAYRNRLYLAYPTSDASKFCQFALVYNSEESTFARLELNNGYGFDVGFVTDASSASPTWGTADSLVWDTQDGASWNKGVEQPSTPSLLMYESDAADTEWWLVSQTFDGSNSDGSAKLCVVERDSLPIEGAKGVTQVNWAILEVEGDLVDTSNDQVPLKVQFGGQESVKGKITWDPTVHELYLDNQHVLDPRITGRYIAWRVESEGLGRWTLGAINIEWEHAGLR
jgi:hypothetical protein